MRSLLLGLALALAANTAGTALAATAPPSTSVERDAYGDLRAGYTDEGDPYLGSPDAPVTLEEWSDYLCPYCRRHHVQTLPSLIEKYVRPGKLRLVFRDFPLERLHPNAVHGHVAARCAAEQRADGYWAFHDALFADQAWARLPDPARYLAETAARLGFDPERYRRCIASGEQARRVQASVTAGQALGLSGTPQFRFLSSAGAPYPLGGAQQISRFETVLELLLAGKAPEPEAKPQAAQLPFWANAEGLAPDPQRPGYTVAGDPFRGDPRARLVVVEFSDFQCPACARHAMVEEPAIDAALVDTGKVRWVVKHLPLKAHPQAPLAAVAAECAGQQGRFWEMRRRLFAHAGDWAHDDAETALLRQGLDLGLERAKFQACLDGRRALERVLRDLYDSQGFVDRTPSFVILAGGPTGSITGPQPAERFIKLLDSMLAPQSSPQPSTNPAIANR